MATRPNKENQRKVTKEIAVESAKLIGLDISQAEIENLLPMLQTQADSLKTLRAVKIPKAVEPDLVFSPERV